MDTHHHLSNVRYDKALRLQKGNFVHNYKELATKLRFLTNEEFDNFLEGDKNKIINWLHHNYQDEKLISNLKTARTRKQYVRKINNRIKSLERRKKQLQQKEVDIPTPTISTILLFVAIIIIINMILFQFVYVRENKDYPNDINQLKNKLYETEDVLKNQINQINALESLNRDLEDKLNDRDSEVIIIPKEESVPTPRDRILFEDIRVNGTHFSIMVDNALVAVFRETGSMLPVLDSSSTAIQIIPKNSDEIHPGDIISYDSENDGIIIHRVIEVGFDFKGWYAVTKGDNNPSKDPERVRFNQVRRVLIAIIY